MADNSSPIWEPLVDALLESEAHAWSGSTPIPRDSETVWRQRWLEAFEHFRNIALPVSTDLQLYWDHQREDDIGYWDYIREGDIGYRTIYDRAWLVLKKPGHTPRYPEPDPDALTLAFIRRRRESLIPHSPRQGLVAHGYGASDGSITWLLTDEDEIAPHEPCTDSALLARLDRMIRHRMWAIPDDALLPLSYVRRIALIGGGIIAASLLLPLILHLR